MLANKPVLLVEDDPVDAMTVKHAFKDLQIINRLDIVPNGPESLNYLQGADNQNPCIILLDLKYAS